MPRSGRTADLPPRGRPQARAHHSGGDPHRQFAAIQRGLAADALGEYIQHQSSALFAVPPGTAPGGFVGEGMFTAARAAGYLATVSERNVAIVESLYRAWAREELSGFVELLDPDVEYVNPEGAIEPGVRKGIDAFVAVMESLRHSWESWRMFPEDFVAIGEEVAVIVRYEARARTSGIAVEGRESALLTLREGMIVRYEWFHGPEDAVRAAETR